ncbi:MAG TPA: 30S ribosomal protein S12 methylthiotransferase RimO, partial [Actinomycetota bacterium]|nr:30S ribosomal protein S12 methylthiotransferase RimO [Actinomycetota bacterium]
PEVLKRMGRWGARDRFERMIDRIRSADPLAGLRATFILGFPGEKDEDAFAVESFVDDSDLDWIGTFTYSREEGTRSYPFEDQVPDEVARERVERVAGVADRAMERRARSLVGKRLKVLVERFDVEENVWTGRSQREAPEIDGEIRFTTTRRPKVGGYVEVELTATDGADLVGVGSADTVPSARG